MTRFDTGLERRLTRNESARLQISKVSPKRKKVDAGIDLQLGSPAIRRDAAILEKLKVLVRSNIGRPGRRGRLRDPATLYTRYRGNGFPLSKVHGKRVPRWKDLTPWMKVQMATMVLGDRGYMAFKLHIHDDLRAQWISQGKDLKVGLRNSMQRHLKRRFGMGKEPWFFFVMEDLTTAGDFTRPHAHGCIELRPAPIPTCGEGSRRLRRLAHSGQKDAAELEAAKLLIKKALKAASGGSGPRIAETSGSIKTQLLVAQALWNLLQHRMGRLRFPQRQEG